MVCHWCVIISCTVDKCAESVWCFYVNMNQNLKELVLVHCWIYATKNWPSPRLLTSFYYHIWSKQTDASDSGLNAKIKCCFMCFCARLKWGDLLLFNALLLLILKRVLFCLHFWEVTIVLKSTACGLFKV